MAIEGPNTHAEGRYKMKRHSRPLSTTTMLCKPSIPLFAPSLPMHGEVDKDSLS